MNPLLQSILDKLQNPENLTPEQKDSLLKALKEEDKHQAQLQFKLDRAEKDRRTLSVMLEESIEDLQKKNRNLEIESSLERVRTVAMGMRNPEDLLTICESLFQELQKLGFSELRNSMINIYDDEKTSFLNFDYSNHSGKTITPHFYNSHPVIQNQVNQVRSSLDAFSEVVFAGEDLKDWKKIRKKKGEPDDPKVDMIDSLYYYFYSIGTGAIGISTYSPIPEAKLNVLKRFRNVFDFAYRRYADVTQAEAQAKDARIEASLERVRAQAMSLRKSEELADVVKVIFMELKSLGFVDLRNTEVIINNDGKESILSYYYSDYGIIGSIEVFYKTNPTVQHWAQELKKASDAFAIIEIPETEMDAWRKYREEIGYAPDPKLNEAKFVFYYSYSTGLGALSISSFAPVSEEQINILERFKNVFGLAYRRYADLTQAEAQAREAQIELALERVRARTMAMQKSEELSETAFILFQQFRELGEEPIQLTIGIYHEIEGVIEFRVTDWAGGGSQIDRGFNLSIEEPTLLKKAFTAWKEQKKSLVVDLTGKELQGWIDYRNAHTGVSIQSNDTSGRRVVSIAFFSKGHISISSAEPRPPETVLLLERFAGVFDLTYTRFLDLKNAEAQIREAKIEAALERVRSKTMAMHNSQDVGDTISTLFDELVKLGITTNRCGILIFNNTNITEVWTAKANPQGDATLIIGHLDVSIHPMLQNVRIAWTNKESLFSYELASGDLKNYYQAINDAQYYPTRFKMDALPFKEIHTDFYFGEGCIFAFTAEPIPADFVTLFKRFAGVFGQTYRRFLDLQKAEAQARQAQIEAAMEKVRSRALAMQKPDELLEVAELLRKEMGLLGVEELETSSIYIQDEAKESTECWYAIKDIRDNDKQLITDHMTILLSETWVGREMLAFYQSEQKQTSILMQGEMRKEWINYCASHSKVLQGYYGEVIPERTYHLLKFSNGYMGAASLGAISDESWNLLHRAIAVFSLAYTRFLDLQKAAAQAQEAQVELALERVRARTMAMHKSEELAETASVVFRQLTILGIEPNRLYITLIKDDSGIAEFWITDEDGSKVSSGFTANLNDNSSFKKMYDGWKEQKKSITIDMQGKELEEYFHHLTQLHVPFKDGLSQKRRVQNITYFNNGFIGMASPEDQPRETLQLLERFSAVFNLTYTRFLDLQRAEAQAREAKIEASLERVRSKAMAMHSSDDLASTVDTFFGELKSLGVLPHRCGVNLIDKETHTAELKATTATRDGESMKVSGRSNLFGHPILANVYNHWLEQKEYHPVLHGHEIKDYYKVMSPQIDFPNFAEDETQYGYYFFFTEGAVYTWSENELSENELRIFRRFTSAISLTYRRYKDLKDAEEQVREATIEAALEKVRGKAMAMHTSSDLTTTASMVFTELRKLGISPMRCGVSLHHKEHRKNLLYSATALESGDDLSLVGWALLDGHPVLSEIYDSWLRGEDYFPVLKDELLKTYYEKIRHSFSVPVVQWGTEQYGYFLPFSEGSFYGWSEKPFTESEIKILKRFASVIDLTFRRYLDLQKSEANALEAVRRASLDRVRAETASMRTTADLERITPLIWNELTTLGVPFIRCGVFIMDEAQQQIHTFLSTPDGKAIASFNTPFSNSSGLTEALPHWRKNEMYKTHWDEEAFLKQTKSLMEQGAISSPEKYLTENRPTSLHLHFLPFLQGMLYVGDVAPLSDEHLQWVQALADAFSTAYARYEDFNKLESAKGQIEKTLVDLKQTQAQLVQSEKMASLGELTAGIAHEIQNPLNFVNNFSEVSNELLDEMVEEVKKGNYEEVKAIAHDVKQNLDKINHHGKRADAIVKGMLQHSRSSSAVKEPTDINKLVDEYLRLAYHGLRAKDKSFNAKFETVFDESILKVNVIPQDIGRVVLNLITNAFYAVTERKIKQPQGYEPIVVVSTKGPLSIHGEGKVEIRVKDNGNGIPQKVLDKIFQPFFTTKPTGQGTGLGLSLSYDIVKAHGGELKVETKEGEGADFIIQLPI